jgi:hypothetical protein
VEENAQIWRYNLVKVIFYFTSTPSYRDIVYGGLTESAQGFWYPDQCYGDKQISDAIDETFILMLFENILNTLYSFFHNI